MIKAIAFDLNDTEKYKIVIVTDAPRNKAWQRLVLCGLQDYFKVVVTSTDTGKLKPDELPFRELLKHLNLKPGEVLMVGDSVERDIKGAEKAGMKAVLVSGGELEDLVV